MKILLDMNISPAWIPLLQKAGYSTLHWRDIGSITAPDIEIMKWARENEYIIFTHDLDFSAILFATGAKAPSVIQLRCEDLRPHIMGEIVIRSLRKIEKDLKEGALATINPRKSRIRLLPFKKKDK